MKKHLRHLFTLCLMLSVFLIPGIQAQAAGNTIDTAYSCSPGVKYSGAMTGTSRDSLDAYFYKVDLPKSGLFSINLNTSGARKVRIRFYYADRSKEQWNQVVEWNSSTTKKGGATFTHNLLAGAYYFSIEQVYDGWDDTYGPCYTGNYDFTYSFESAEETFPENQNTTYNELPLSQPVAVNGASYVGQLADNDSIDYYKFNLPSSGKLTFNYVLYCEGQSVVFYDADGDEIWSFNTNWNSTSHMQSYVESNQLASGDYYLVVKGRGWVDWAGKYTFSFNFAPAAETYPEGKGGVNNAIATASPLEFKQTVSGHLAINDDCDYYRLQVPSARNLNIQLLSSEMDEVRVTVFNSNGDEVYSKQPGRNSTTGMINYNDSDASVSAGTYYIYVGKGNWATSKGSYTLTVDTFVPVTSIALNKQKVSLKKGKSVNLVATVVPADATNPAYEWKSSNTNVAKVANGHVTAVAPGTATITVTSKESDKIFATCEITVVPSATKLKTAKRYKSRYSSTRYIYIKYNKVSNVSGYQIVISKKKNFKKVYKRTVTSSNTTYVNVKKGTYYVKVRPYITVGDKRVYGAYSNVKKAKIK